MEFVIIRVPCDVTVLFLCVRQLVKVSRQPETGRLGKNTTSWCIPPSQPDMPPSALSAVVRDQRGDNPDSSPNFPSFIPQDVTAAKKMLA